MTIFAKAVRLFAVAAGAAMLGVSPVGAQTIESIDPDMAIDADLAAQSEGELSPDTAPAPSAPITPPAAPVQTAPEWSDPVVTAETASAAASQAAENPEVAVAEGDTYKQDDLIGAAEDLFGEGAEGLARIIEDILAEQGEPNAYIVGREAGAAFIIGARYGSGTLYHKVEGQRPVYWTGPSIGFDAGANASNTFVLVYNLYDTEQLYERYPAGEGQAYLVGGLTASYLRKDDIVLIPIRVGAGLRLGINAGYMKFTKEQEWMPF